MVLLLVPVVQLLHQPAWGLGMQAPDGMGRLQAAAPQSLAGLLLKEPLGQQALALTWGPTTHPEQQQQPPPPTQAGAHECPGPCSQPRGRGPCCRALCRCRPTLHPCQSRLRARPSLAPCLAPGPPSHARHAERRPPFCWADPGKLLPPHLPGGCHPRAWMMAAAAAGVAAPSSPQVGPRLCHPAAAAELPTSACAPAAGPVWTAASDLHRAIG